MPKKLIKRFIPTPEAVQNHPSLGILGAVLRDPNLFHLNRHSVSMAFLVGVFLAFFPIPAQMVLAAMVAFWVRCNLPLAIALVWITNPLTIPPIFFSTYKLGTLMLDVPMASFEGAAFTWEWINGELGMIWKPLVVGSLSAGLVLSVSSYIVIQVAWRWHVISKWRNRKERRLKKASKLDT